MKTLQIYGDIATRRASNATGTTISLPAFVQGDFIRTTMRLLDEVDGNTVEINPVVRSIKASIGRVQAPPSSGTFKLQVGGLGTPGAKIQYNQDAAKFGQVIGALSGLGAYGLLTDIVDKGNSCWIARFNYNGAVPLMVGENLLSPMCDIRIRAYQKNGIWLHEIKLIQLPIAFTSDYTRVLGPAPTPTEIVAGASTTIDSVTYLTNEVQSYGLDPLFRGTYRIKIKGLATSYFSSTDGIDVIQASLNSMGVPGASFVVTTPVLNKVYVEFAGSLAGAPQALMAIEVGEFAPGNITFDLSLETAEALEAFREAGGNITDMAFEVELTLGEDGEMDESTPGRIITLFREGIGIARELTYAELGTVSGINWLTPIPKDYIPFTPDQIITGTQFYTVVIPGDGTTTAFAIVHNLHTRIGHISIQENVTGGRLLTANGKFTAEFDSNDQITITFSVAPTAGQYVFTFSSAGPVSVFQAHTHTEAQIIGLVADLDAIRARLTILEAFIPNVAGGVIGSGSNVQGMTINLGTTFELLNYRAPAGATTIPAFSSDGSGLDLKTLPKGKPILIAAINTTASPTSLSLPLPDPVSSSGIYTASADMILPGYGGVRGSKVRSGALVGCDGRLFFPIEKGISADSSYYPIPFQRTLWEFAINDVMFSINARLDVAFGIGVQLAMSEENAEWVVAIEKGVFTSATSPGTPDININAVTWDTVNPIIAQRILLTPLYQKHSFGLRMLRTGSTSFTMDKMSYGFFTGANTLVPATANFYLRARLYKFDIDDAIPDARGWLAYQIVSPDGTAASQATITTAQS